MQGLWMIVGLSCFDSDFLSEMTTKGVRPTVLKYGFHLSNFEIGELELMLKTEDILRAFNVIHAYWDPDVCFEKMLDPKNTYKHGPTQKWGGFQKPYGAAGGTGST